MDWLAIYIFTITPSMQCLALMRSLAPICLLAPKPPMAQTFNRWKHSWGCWAHWTIDLTETWVLWQLQLTVILPEMQYKQYLDSENMVLFLYMPLSTLQPVGAQPGPSGPSDN